MAGSERAIGYYIVEFSHAPVLLSNNADLKLLQFRNNQWKATCSIDVRPAKDRPLDRLSMKSLAPFYLAALIPVAFAADPALVLQVSSETAPPGGSAQIKVSLSAPALIATGTLSMDFDPTVFGNVASVSVFSATGDQIGYANVHGQHVDAHFSSTSGGIGQLPGLPVLAISLPVLAGAKAGATTQVTGDPMGVNWTDSNGTSYAVTVNPATFTVGGSLSIASVTPGGGLLPQGTAVSVAGTGFEPTTSISMDGVAISSVQYIGPQQMSLTLGGPAELTGKRVHIANANGASVDYFSALPSAGATLPAGFTALPGIHPIIPLSTYTNIEIFPASQHAPNPVGYALLNPGVTPVTVSLEGASNVPASLPSNIILTKTLTIPPGTLYFLDADPILTAVSVSFTGTLWITPSAPVRMVIYSVPYSFGDPNIPPVVSTPPLTPNNPPPPLEVLLPVAPPAISWSWQVGTAQPAPANIQVSGSLDFTVSIQPSASMWLSVAPSKGTAPATLTLTPNFAALTPGNYSATVSVTPTVPSSLAGYTAKTTTVTVTVTVTAAPLVAISGACCVFFAPGSNGSSLPQTLTITTNGNPVPFTLSVIPGTGGNWLSVSALSGTTPATLTVSANPAGLSDGDYTSQIVLQSQAGTITIPVRFEVQSPPAPPGPGILFAPSSLSFVLAAGSGPPATPQVITIHPNGVAFSAVTQSGGPWMSTALFANDFQTIIQVNASAVGLSPGTYQGTITITSGALPPAQVGVTLTVLPDATAQSAIKAMPSIVFLSVPAGQMRNGSIALDSGGTPLLFSLALDTIGIPEWLQGDTVRSALPGGDGQVATPATISFQADASNLLPGTYHHRFTLTWATGSLIIPITLTVTPTASLPPILSSVVNAASATEGAIAPGEIITILGTGIGPTPTGLTLDPSGKVATNVTGTQVLINGTPAPLIYVSSTQINAIVPYEAGTSGSPSLQVISAGVPSSVWNIPLTAASPAIFSIASNGSGQGAVLNQDNSVNGPSNPAARGTLVQIYATGEGLTSPPGVTGSVTGSNTKSPVLPVNVAIGGVSAPVQYEGSAPDAVAGLFQVNAVVPAGVAPGAAVPVTLTVGGATSQRGVTIAVR
jgi:uncharacterized protein (TIGR03437 family)